MQVGPFYPPCKSSIQKEHPVEKAADIPVFYIGKNRQCQFRLQGGMNFHPKTFTLGFKIMENGRNICHFTQTSRTASLHQLTEDSDRHIGSNVIFPFDIGRQNRIQQFIGSRLGLSPQGAEPLGHLPGTNFIIGGDRPLLFPYLLPGNCEKIQYSRFVRFLTFPKIIPDLLIKPGKRHTAGIAVECIRRFHGIGHQINTLLFTGLLYRKPEGRSLCLLPFFARKTLCQRRCVETACDN